MAGLAASTRRISSSWRPGRSIDGRSSPSDSHSPVVPTTSTTASAAAAASSARRISPSGSGGRRPTRSAPDVRAVENSSDHLDRDAGLAARRAPRPRRCPARSRRCPGGTARRTPSMTAVPSTTTRPLPACTSVNTWVPVSSGVKVVWARNDQPASPRPGTGGSRPKRSAVGEWRCCTGSPARSGPANQSTARPGSPPGAVVAGLAEQRGAAAVVAAALVDDGHAVAERLGRAPPAG